MKPTLNSRGGTGLLYISIASTILFLSSIACASSTPKQTPASPLATVHIRIPTKTSTIITKLVVESGELYLYIGSYEDYETVNVKKLDGTLDPRPNDLEELCLDWIFYRQKILEYERSGETEKASEARRTWNDVNRWLDEYDEGDIGSMWTIIENRP